MGASDYRFFQCGCWVPDGASVVCCLCLLCWALCLWSCFWGPFGACLTASCSALLGLSCCASCFACSVSFLHALLSVPACSSAVSPLHVRPLFLVVVCSDLRCVCRCCFCRCRQHPFVLCYTFLQSRLVKVWSGVVQRYSLLCPLVVPLFVCAVVCCVCSLSLYVCPGRRAGSSGSCEGLGRHRWGPCAVAPGFDVLVSY